MARVCFQRVASVQLLSGHFTEMDPVTIAASVLAIVQLTNSSAKIIASLANASKSLNDDRYDELYWRMYAEKQSMVALLTNIETSGRPLSPENVETFQILLARLKISHSKMEDALQRLLPEGGAGFTLRSVVTRLKFDTGGFEELKQRMSSIEAMTRALKLLGETLPNYTPRAAEQSSITTTVSLVSMATDHPTMGQGVPDGEATRNPATPQQERGSQEIPLASLCRLCEDAMVELSSHPMLSGKGTGITGLSARFELWSVGVWGSKDGLMDRILEADPERHEVVGMFVAKSLVNIAVALENIFRAIQNSEVENAEQSLSRSRRAILAALGTGNLVDIAIERWSVLSMSSTDEESMAFEATTADTTADADTTKGSESAAMTSTTTEKATGAAIGSALQDIEFALESLFSINSSIRSIRRSYRLDIESAWEENSSVVDSTVGANSDAVDSDGQPMSTEKQKEYLVLRVVSKDKAAQRLMREETVQLVKLLEDALNNDEASVSDQADSGAGKKMRLLSPEVKTQRLRLEEFEKNSTEIPPDKLKIAVGLNQTLKKTLNSVIVSDNRDAVGKLKQLQATWETDKILDRTMETLGNAVTTITQ